METNKPRSWNAVGIIPTLQVHDVDEAIEFYEQLKFKLEWRFPVSESNGDSHSTHVGLCLGDVTIILGLCDEEEGPVQKQDIYVVMENVRAFHGELKSQMNGQIGELEQADYGMLDFSLEDPWGHFITFGEDNSDRTR